MLRTLRARDGGAGDGGAPLPSASMTPTLALTSSAVASFATTPPAAGLDALFDCLLPSLRAVPAPAPAAAPAAAAAPSMTPSTSSPQLIGKWVKGIGVRFESLGFRVESLR